MNQDTHENHEQTDLTRTQFEEAHFEAPDFDVPYFKVPLEKVPAIGERTFLQVDDRFLVLFNIQGQFYAIDDRCPHQGASLFGGKLDGCTIQCGAHGLRFDVATGFLVNSKSMKISTYAVHCVAQRLYILLDQESAHG